MDLQNIVGLLSDARTLRSGVIRSAPESASVAQHDLKITDEHFGTRRPIQRLVHCVDLWTVVASEQIYGLSVLLSDGTATFPVFPLLRSVIEHCAWIAWVLDQQATIRERAARAALSALRSKELAYEAACNMAGKPTPNELKESLNRLRSEVANEFGTLSTSPLCIDDIQMPSPTSVIDFAGAQLLGTAKPWRGFYGYLCGTANHPSLNADEFFDLTNPSDPHAFIPNDLLHLLLRDCMVPYVNSLDNLCVYMGWGTSDIESYRQRLDIILPGP